MSNCNYYPVVPHTHTCEAVELIVMVISLQVVQCVCEPPGLCVKM